MRRAQNHSRCAARLKGAPMHELSIVTYARQAGAGDRQGKQPHRDSSRSRSNSVRSPALCRNILKIAGIGIPRKSRSFRARNSCMRSSRPSPGATTASKPIRPYNTAKHARIAAVARPGCSRAMRSISSRSRRADRAGPSAYRQQRYTKAVAQPLLIEKQTKRE